MAMRDNAELVKHDDMEGDGVNEGSDRRQSCVAARATILILRQV